MSYQKEEKLRLIFSLSRVVLSTFLRQRRKWPRRRALMAPRKWEKAMPVGERERESNRGRSRWNEGTCGRLDTFGFKGAWRDVRDITKKQKCCQTRKEKGMRKGGENVGNHHLLWRRSSERPWRWLAPHVSCFARRVMLARHYRWWYTRNENVFLPNSERGSRLLFIWVRRKKNRFK